MSVDFKAIARRASCDATTFHDGYTIANIDLTRGDACAVGVEPHLKFAADSRGGYVVFYADAQLRMLLSYADGSPELPADAATNPAAAAISLVAWDRARRLADLGRAS